MDYNELKDSIRNLTEVIKNIPDGISSVISGGPGSSARSTAGTVAGASARYGMDTLSSLFPKFGKLGDSIVRLTDNMIQANRLINTSKSLGSSSPLGSRGLDAVQRSVMNRFVSRDAREKVLDQVAVARKDLSTYQNLLKRSNQDKRNYQDARDSYNEAVVKHQSAVTERDRLKKNATRADRARAKAWSNYQATLSLHSRYPSGKSPWLVHLRADKKRFDQADRLARRLVRRSRMAGRNVIESRAARGVAARAARAAGAAARGSAGAANAAGATAQASANAASKAAAAATGTGATMALVGVAASAMGVVNAFGELFKTTYNLSDRMSNFAESVHAQNRQSAAFAPKLAAALNQLSIHDLSRRMTFAAGTEDSAVKLAHAIDELRESQLKGGIAQQNVSNTFATFAAKFAAPIEAEKSRMWEEVDRFTSGVFGGEGMNSAAEAFGTAVGAVIIGPLTEGLKIISDSLGFEKKGNVWVGKGGPADNFVERIATEHARNVGPVRKDKRDGLGDRWNPLKK